MSWKAEPRVGASGTQCLVKRELARDSRRVMTASERRLWQRLRANRLGGLHFRRQQLASGFVPDFYCHSALLVVEVDGGVHEAQTEYDRERDRILASLGILVVRFKNEQVDTNMKAVLREILAVARPRMANEVQQSPADTVFLK